MIILDGDKLRSYWDSIARGFQKSPLEAAISIVIIALLIALPVVIFLNRQKKQKKRKALRAREVFDIFAARHSLTERDREVLIEMCRHTAKGELDLANLVTKPASFNAAAKRLSEAGFSQSAGIRDADIAGLRIKLGLVQSGSRGILHSTAELRPGMQVALESGRKQIAKVLEVKPEGFQLQTAEKLTPGSSVELRVRRSTGLYSLNTTVVGRSGNGYILRHTENIKRVQKRRYFRKVSRLPVLFTTDDPSLGSFKTRLVDLSAGGARMRNPGVALKAGDAVHLSIIHGGAEPIKLNSRVTRLSPDRALMSVAFESLKDSTRDLLMRMVFS
jgi:hypothetical protein